MFTRLIRDIIKSIYENFANVCLLSFLFMFFYMSVKEKGLKATITKWIHEAVTDSSFRKVFLLAVYTFLILTKTILTRSVWYDPYGHIFDGWNLSLAAVENAVLFIPFTFLLLWNVVKNDQKERFAKQLIYACLAGFALSFAIEFLQLVTKLGTFQFSDIFYNTVGGIIGVILFTLIHMIRDFFSKKGRGHEE